MAINGVGVAINDMGVAININNVGKDYSVYDIEIHVFVYTCTCL